MLSSIISAVVVGFIVGLLGRLILPGRQNISLLATTAIGVVAALLAGVVLGATAYSNANGGIPWFSLLLGAVFAAVGIVIYGRSRARS